LVWACFHFDVFEQVLIKVLGFQEFLSDDEHAMWVFTEWGLNKYNYEGQTFTHFFHDGDNPNSLLNDRISGIYLDDQDILWIASGGVNKLDLNQNLFEHIKMKTCPDQHHHINATCFFEDYEGFIWVGSYKDGLYQLDANMNMVSCYKPTPGNITEKDKSFRNHVYLIFEDSRHNLWVCTNHFSINILNRSDKSFNEVHCQVPDGHPRPHVINDILEDSAGILWFGSHYGLYTKEVSAGNNTALALVEDPVLSRARIFDLFEDSDKSLWIITVNHGIFRLSSALRNELKYIHYPQNQYNPKNKPDYNIREAFEDKNGMIWFRSEGRLYTYNNEHDQIQPAEHFSETYQNLVYDFTGDTLGYLWFVTDRGLLRYNPGDTSSTNTRIFDTREGLPFDEINHSSFFKCRQGFFYMGSFSGSGNGFFRFRPETIKDENKKIPPVVITGFNIRNEPYLSDTSLIAIKHIYLKHNQNFFSFKFAALDYISPSKNQYAYILDGFEENWIGNGNSRTANYTGVPPGDYIFMVKGSNNEGVWNEKGTSVAITILPPPWKTWWAYSLYGIALFVVLLMLRLYDLKRQRLKQNLEIEKVEKDKLGELDKMKSRFFANISHEFRTPLTLILGPLGNLEKEASNEKSKNELNIIQRNALRLQQLINQLLSLSKLESGQMKLQSQELNIVQLVRGYTQSFESLAIQKGIKLEFDSNEDKLMLWVDQDKVEKILYNLLSNAFKFTGTGGSITVRVARYKTQDSGQWSVVSDHLTQGGIVISVIDTGSGIDKDRLPHIFDRFYQADDTYKADAEGTGIGLALTKELVELHHGTISVNSERGTGSRFEVFLPLGEAHLKSEEKSEKWSEAKPRDIPPKAGKDEKSGARQSRETSRQRRGELTSEYPELTTYNLEPTTDSSFETDSEKPILLIVEDNSDLRVYIRGHLEEDYNIIEAKDGEQGLERAIEHIPDLVLSDVMMPEMDGFELCSKLKTDERTSHIPVILLTARASSESKIEGLETGADDFITKPFDPQELLVRINNLINLRKKLREDLINDLSKPGFPKFETATTSINSADQEFIKKASLIVEKHLDDQACFIV